MAWSVPRMVAVGCMFDANPCNFTVVGLWIAALGIRESEVLSTPQIQGQTRFVPLVRYEMVCTVVK